MLGGGTSKERTRINTEDTECGSTEATEKRKTEKRRAEGRKKTEKRKEQVQSPATTTATARDCGRVGLDHGFGCGAV